MKVTLREAHPRKVWSLEQSGVHPLLARLFAARGVSSASDLDDKLAMLLAPDSLKGIQQAAALLAMAIAAEEPICVVADYDCDGATACAVALRGLSMLGAKKVSYLVPNRVVDGYGLTAPIAERVAASGARVLITVDNGIASVQGVMRARELGMRVLVTDHHLPAEELPDADAIVNPNQPGCAFASRHLAGVGVMFYVLLALRTRLREAGAFDQATQPRLDSLLPLVALGTVADVVRLDANNRRLVSQGLRRIRSGQATVGILALLQVARRDPAQVTAFDLGFALGPRINAAGRLADMRLGIECLLTDDPTRASELATRLDDINRQRRDLEAGMRDTALQTVLARVDQQAAAKYSVCVFDEAFHEGVVGIVAARLKDRFHRPAFVFAPGHGDDPAGVLKGSGRSIAGFHLRDALDLVAKREPGVLIRFGGHAMAAGCTIARDQFSRFALALDRIAGEWLDADALDQRIECDGSLPVEYRRVDVAKMLQSEVWGQGFAQPLFCDEFEVISQRVVADRHLALRMRHAGHPVEGIWFGHATPLPAIARLVYRLDTDEYQGMSRVKLIIEAQAQPDS